MYLNNILVYLHKFDLYLFNDLIRLLNYGTLLREIANKQM